MLATITVLVEVGVVALMVLICISTIIDRLERFMLAMQNADTTSQIAILEAKARTYCHIGFDEEEDEGEQNEEQHQEDYAASLQSQVDTIVSNARDEQYRRCRKRIKQRGE